MSGLHMSWCDGTHTELGECCLVANIGAEEPVLLVGLYCDTMRIDLDPGFLTNPEQAEALAPVLLHFAQVMRASAADIDHDQHEEHDDEEDEYDEETTCQRCQTLVPSTWLVHGLGYLCPPCCDAVGHPEAYDRDEELAA